MTFLNTLHARVARAQAADRHADPASGIIGMVMLIVGLVLALLYLFATTFSGSTDGNKQKNRIEASTLIQQAGSLRTTLATMSANSTITWTALGADYSTGSLALVNGSTSYKEGATLSQGPKGSNDAPVTWHFASFNDPVRGTPQVWAYTDATVTSAQCYALNDILRPGGATNPLSSAAMNSASGTTSEATDGYAYLQLASGQRLTALQGMLANEACYDTGGGNFMFVARMN